MNLDRDEIINALHLAQEVIHNEKHTVCELSDQVYNTCLVTIQYLLDNFEDLDTESYDIDEDISEMLDHDRRFMSYEYKNLKGE